MSSKRGVLANSSSYSSHFLRRLGTRLCFCLIRGVVREAAREKYSSRYYSHYLRRLGIRLCFYSTRGIVGGEYSILLTIFLVSVFFFVFV